MKSKPNAIAIDGPAASGKSTLAIALAQHLDYLYFDTGVMYRGITLLALNGGSLLPDESRCVELAVNARIDVNPPSKTDGRLYDVIIDGEDKTFEIRQPEVDANVSIVSAYPDVRSALTMQQRRIGLQGGVVMVGRDIGTVVLPEAELKIFLDASAEERARRRYAEIMDSGGNTNYQQVLDAMQRRDKIDTNRLVAPLRAAEDAKIISSDGKNAQEVLAEIIQLLENSEKLTAN